MDVDLIKVRVEDAHPRASIKHDRISRLVDLFKAKGTRGIYNQWRQDPVTQAFIDAVRELTYIPYGSGTIASPGTHDVELGMTYAFQFVERLLSDPESVINVFSEDQEAEVIEPEMNTGYTSAPDE